MGSNGVPGTLQHCRCHTAHGNGVHVTTSVLTQEWAVIPALGTEVPERVNCALSSEITGPYISTLLANLTLSSNGSLDHPDTQEGRDDDKGRDNEIPEFGKAAFPAPANHSRLGELGFCSARPCRLPNLSIIGIPGSISFTHRHCVKCQLYGTHPGTARLAGRKHGHILHLCGGCIQTHLVETIFYHLSVTFWSPVPSHILSEESWGATPQLMPPVSPVCWTTQVLGSGRC